MRKSLPCAKNASKFESENNHFRALQPQNYKLEKWIWTDADFDRMSWHESLIYAFKIDQHIYFDIDYIFEWVKCNDDKSISFWVAPCTLIFENVWNSKFDIDTSRYAVDYEIADLHRQVNNKGNAEFRIEMHIGEILIESEHFRQIVRRAPTFQFGQQVISEERGEVSFSEYPDKEFKVPQAALQAKHERLKNIQTSNCINALNKELLDIYDKHIAGTLATKQYILNKRELENQIESVSKLLYSK